MIKPLYYYLVCLLITIIMDANAQILPKTKPVKFLALGDSYTVGESVAEVQRWPDRLMEALKKKGYTCGKPKVVAMTGWRTDDLKKAIEAASLSKDYDLVSLLIGVNNQYQGKSISEYETEFEGLLNTAIQHAGGEKKNVFVLSIPDYGFTPFGKERQKKITSQIDAFNEVNRAVTEKKGVPYINITDISRRGLAETDLVAEDGLHPSGTMYILWVERILERLTPDQR